MNSTSDVFEDVRDEQNTTDNVFLKSETSSIALIFYQDAFEVINPLGSGQENIFFFTLLMK